MLLGVDFVLELNSSTTKSVQIQPDVFKTNKVLFFFFLFFTLPLIPISLTPYQIFCSDLWDSEFQYVLLYKGYVTALPGNTCVKNREN